METQQPSYIVPIITPKGSNYEFAGTGFIVGHYLITASHVVDHWTGFGLSTIIGGKLVELDLFSQKLNIPPNQERDCLDFAVFAINLLDVNSPLSLADEEPPYGDKNGTIMTSKHFQPQGDGDAFYRECDCLVTGHSLDFNHCFEGYNFSKTTPGASGSPLIQGNVVYGMLVKGLIIQGDFQAMKEEAERKGIPCTEKDIDLMSYQLTFLKASEIKKRMIEKGLLL